ncbi:MAG TPA: hypothetical protein VFH77_17365 [Streptomyces sp.]|nr:hypothetical protein [Streptomyces sp.]
MSPLNLVGIALAAAAVIGVLLFGLPDGWFFSLLALASMLGAADEAYQENQRAAAAFLAASAVFAATAGYSVYRDRGAR